MPRAVIFDVLQHHISENVDRLMPVFLSKTELARQVREPEKRRGRTMRGTGTFVALLAAGCALVSATPPRIEVATVELSGAGLLEQTLRVGLCVFNPNDQELAFRGISIGIDLAGAPLAVVGSESSVRLPPHQSVLVHFGVAVTLRNLGSQLLATLTTGAVDYRLHGSVQLAGSLGFTIPFSRRGRLDLMDAGQALLSDQAAASSVSCDGMA